MRFADLNLSVGEMESGPLRRISDVPGVTVGHCTVSNERHQTGVTAVLPCADDPFEQKLPCACYVLNGFGKSLGLMQVEELGQLETPIALTNTLNVGRVHDALVSYVIGQEREKGVHVWTLNPVVCECNDASLNDLEDRVIGETEVFSAIRDAKADFPVGAVGAGRGMTCHGLKGGIGSASRVIRKDGTAYTVGVLALTNHGRLHDLQIGGEAAGRMKQKSEQNNPAGNPGRCHAADRRRLFLSGGSLPAGGQRRSGIFPCRGRQPLPGVSAPLRAFLLWFERCRILPAGSDPGHRRLRECAGTALPLL